MRSRAHLLISGRVQGVSFRYFAREKALSLGLKGWVRNLRDGRVECELEGAKEAVEAMIGFCSEGPRWAKVTHVEAKWMSYTGKYDRFRVLL